MNTELIKLIKEALENSKENGYDPNEFTDEVLASDLMDHTDIGYNYEMPDVVRAITFIRSGRDKNQ